MSDNPITAVSAETWDTTFPPMYYDSPVNQMVLGFDVVLSDDSLTAAITAGAPYFKVTAIDVCDWIETPVVTPVGPGELPTKTPASPPSSTHLPPTGATRHLSAPVATSDGITPLVVNPGQYARLWVTADVPKGAALPPREIHWHGRADRQDFDKDCDARRNLSRHAHGKCHRAAGDGVAGPVCPGASLRRIRQTAVRPDCYGHRFRVSRPRRATTSSRPSATAISSFVRSEGH